MLTYGLAADADVRATTIDEDARGLRVGVATSGWSGSVALRLAGRFNAHNALAAIALGIGWDLDLEAVRSGLEAVAGVPGRMERIDRGQPFAVIVDYAHSPAALRTVLDLLGPVASAGGGGLIAVFGSAGERDTEKRPMMGRVAGERCRLVVLTDEDPRGEDRDAILDAIAAGAEDAGRRRTDLLLVPDRARAIATAFGRAGPGDLVLLAGKGHEPTIIGSSGSSTTSAFRSPPSTARAARPPTWCCCARSSRWASRSRARTCSRRTSPACRPGTRSAPASDGYIARKKEVDFLVAMNPETAKEDVLTLEPGAAVVYDEPLKLNALRNDLDLLSRCRSTSWSAPVCPDAKLRRLVRNMIYDGVLAKLLGIDLALMEKALAQAARARRRRRSTLNAGALKAGFDYAEANLTKQDPFVIEPMNETAGKILIEGNAAAAIGCMLAGVTVVAWYPITPSSSLCESLIDYMKKYRDRQGDRQGDVRDRAGRRRDRRRSAW